jgi:hypothetical protein
MHTHTHTHTYAHTHTHTHIIHIISCAGERWSLKRRDSLPLLVESCSRMLTYAHVFSLLQARDGPRGVVTHCLCSSSHATVRHLKPGTHSLLLLLPATHTRLLLHAYCYTPTVTRLRLHASSYTPTVTRLLLHAYSCTPAGTGGRSARARTCGPAPRKRTTAWRRRSLFV